MKTIISILFLFVTTIAVGQIDFVKQVELLLQARRAKADDKKVEALKLYEAGFAIDIAQSKDEYLSAAELAAELNKPEICEKWIIEGIVKKKVEKTSIENKSDNALYQKIAKDVLNNYNNHLAKFYKNLKDPVAYFKIQKILNRDQETRMIKDYYFELTPEIVDAAVDSLMKYNKPKDSLIRKKYANILWPKLNAENDKFHKKVFSYADSLNVRELIDVTKEHGWQEDGWMILWHQRGIYGKESWVWDFFKPYINKEIEKGNIRPFFWALLEDFTSMLKTGKTKYGFYPGKINADTVNQNRKSIGLPLLTEEEIASRNNRTDNGSIF